MQLLCPLPSILQPLLQVSQLLGLLFPTGIYSPQNSAQSALWALSTSAAFSHLVVGAGMGGVFISTFLTGTQNSATLFFLKFLKLTYFQTTSSQTTVQIRYRKSFLETQGFASWRFQLKAILAEILNANRELIQNVAI